MITISLFFQASTYSELEDRIAEWAKNFFSVEKGITLTIVSLLDAVTQDKEQKKGWIVQFYVQDTKKRPDLIQILPIQTGYFEAIKKINRGQNQAYRKGRRFEQYIVRLLRKHGWFAKRNFGSHGTKIGGISYQDDGFAYRNGVALFWTAKWSGIGDTEPEHWPELEKVIALAEMYGGIPIFVGKRGRRVYFLNMKTEEDFSIE